MTIEVPVKPHVLAWLRDENLYKVGEIMEVTRKTPIFGRVIWGFFAKYNVPYKSVAIQPANQRPGRVMLLIKFPIDVEKVDDDMVENLANLIDDFFDLYMTGFVAGYCSLRNSRLAGVKRFIEQYDMQDDLLAQNSAYMRVARFSAEFKSRRNRKAEVRG